LKWRNYIQSQEEKRLATHGSHEYTTEKEKRKILDCNSASKDLPKDDDLTFILAFLL